MTLRVGITGIDGQFGFHLRAWLQYHCGHEVVGAGRRTFGSPEDLTAFVRGCDAIVHLAGGLGVPTLVMVPRNPEWRYAASGSSTPWYRSVTVYRREGEEGWDAVLARVIQAVRARLAQDAT